MRPEFYEQRGDWNQKRKDQIVLERSVQSQSLLEGGLGRM